MIVLGEALVDLVTEADGRLRPVEGGAARNLAIAAARLGAEVSYVGGLSSDPFGRALRTGLAREGVDLSLTVGTDAPTPLAVVHLGADGQPSYSFHLEGSAALAVADALARVGTGDVLHLSLGAVTLATPSVGPALARTLAAHDGLRSLDPNVRAAFVTDVAWHAAAIAELAADADLVKCSDEDLVHLHPDEDPTVVAQRWVDGGAGAVVVTRGAQGATAVTPLGTLDVGAGSGAPARPVVDTVGAGDTFGAALLVWLSEHDVGDRAGLDALTAADWTAALGFASRAAAITVTRVGADPPYRHELA